MLELLLLPSFQYTICQCDRSLSHQLLTFQVTTPVVKQGPVSQSATQQQPVTADKPQGHEPVSPRSLQRSK